MYSRTSLVRTPGDRQMHSPYPEFVLTVFLLTRFKCNCVAICRGVCLPDLVRRDYHLHQIDIPALG